MNAALLDPHPALYVHLPVDRLDLPERQVEGAGNRAAAGKALHRRR